MDSVVRSAHRGRSSLESRSFSASVPPLVQSNIRVYVCVCGGGRGGRGGGGGLGSRQRRMYGARFVATTGGKVSSM